MEEAVEPSGRRVPRLALPDRVQGLTFNLRGLVLQHNSSNNKQGQGIAVKRNEEEERKKKEEGRVGSCPRLTKQKARGNGPSRSVGRAQVPIEQHHRRRVDLRERRNCYGGGVIVMASKTEIYWDSKRC